VSGWKPSGFTVADHARLRLPLEGAHARAACEACHVPATSAAGRTFGRAKGTSCQDCHADPHVGQFAAGGRTDCARCHAPNEAFETPHFDHARDARFALDATHAKLDCARCHVPTPLASGGSAIRYKPLGTACADCHAPARR
jgi:Zn finger protein HypA/HybF involved in hydrogenase expression